MRARVLHLIVGLALLLIGWAISPGSAQERSCKDYRLEPIAQEYGEPEEGASGSVCLNEQSIGSLSMRIKLNGLKPEESYWLSMNAGSPENLESDILATRRVPGWPPGRYYEHPSGKKEGYWDFKEITPDVQGKFEGTIVLPLPPADYIGMKFFLKKSYKKGGKVVLHNDVLSFKVKGTLTEWWWILLLIGFSIGVALYFAWGRKKLPAGGTKTKLESDISRGSDFTYSPDFRWVCLNGQPFTLTPSQAQVIRLLFEAHEKKTPELGQSYILEQIESTSRRLRDLFKSSPKAWKELIRPGAKRGTFRLNI